MSFEIREPLRSYALNMPPKTSRFAEAFFSKPLERELSFPEKGAARMFSRPIDGMLDAVSPRMPSLVRGAEMKAVTVNKPDKTLPDQVQQTSFLSDAVCSLTFIITEPLALFEHAWRCRHADGLKYDVHVNPSNVGI